jgi:hypothetical protein
MKNSDFCTKNICRFKKNPIKPTSRWVLLGFFRWVFLGFIGRVFLGGFFIANPALRIRIRSLNPDQDPQRFYNEKVQDLIYSFFVLQYHAHTV